MKIISKESKQTFKTKDGVEKHYTNYYLLADNGKSVQVRCAFSDDYARLAMLSDTCFEGVTLEKRQSKSTYLNKDKVECHYYNYFVVVGKNSIQIRCAYAPDYSKLDMVAVYSRG